MLSTSFAEPTASTRQRREQRDLLADVEVEPALGAAEQHVGLDADAAQLVDRVLRRLRLQLAGVADVGHEREVDVHAVAPADVDRELPDRLEERQRLDVAHRAADLGDDDVDVARLADEAHPLLDLVGDVRDDLDGGAQVVAPALAADDRVVDPAGRDVRRPRRVRVREALVVAEVEIGLGAVLGDEHLAVLVRRHRPGSMLMYGSNFWSPTDSPRATRSRPIDAAAMPLPSEDTTPPVTKMKRVLGRSVMRGASPVVELGRLRRTVAPDADEASHSTAARSSSSAWRRAPSSRSSAPSIRTSSRDHLGVGQLGDRRARRVGGRSLAIEKCRSASEATCGRCVMQTTCPRSASARSCSPTARAVCAADPGVDLVEHERRAAVARRPRDAHEREHHPRQLAARRGLAQRRRGDAGVRRDEELDGVGARAGPASRSASATSNAAPSIASAAEPLADRLGEPRRGRAPRLAQLAREPASSARARASRPSACSERLLGALQLIAPRAGRRRRARAPPRSLPPCLRSRRSRPPSRSSTTSSRARLGVEPLGVAAQLGREILRLDERARASAPPGRRAAGSTPSSASSSARRRGQQRRRAAVAVVGRDRLGAPGQRAPRAAPRRGAAGRARPSSARLLLARAGRLDLRELELEQVELALAGAGTLAQLVERAPRARGPPHARPRPPRAARLLGPAGGVEHLELGGGEREPAVLVLPVEGDERLGELAQVGHAWRSGR